MDQAANNRLDTSSFQEARTAKRPSVLIVEDEFVTGYELRICLEERGFKVVGIAADAMEALALCAEHLPDVAVVDIVISGERDGISLAAAIRQDYDCALVFLTSQSDNLTVSRAVMTHPNGYILKPFTPDDINVAILSALSNHGSRLQTDGDIALARKSAPVSGGLTPSNLNRVRQTIERGLNTPLSVSVLAQQCRLSEKHFSVQFKKSTGLAPHQYITAKRIEEAKRLLTETSLPIAAIALAVGFSSATYFSTAFKRETGINPVEYRALG